MYREDFAVADVATLGTTMTLQTGTNQRIVTQAAQGNASGTTAGTYKYNVGKTASDNQRIDVGIKTPANGTLNSGVGLMFCLRMPDTFATAGAPGTFVIFQLVSSGTWNIQTLNQSTFSGAKVSGTSAGFTTGDQLSFLAIGATYMALRNGVLIPGSVWIDTSNTLAGVGPTKRNFGLLVQCLATNQQHFGVDWFNMEDLGGQFFAAA